MIARLIFALSAWLCLGATPLAGQPAALGPEAPAKAVLGPVQTGHVALELISGGSASPGGTVEVALRQVIAPGWHTYWRNSGDAGQPTEIAWRLPPGVTASAPIWPAPRRLREATLMTYGYQGEVVTPVALRVARSVLAGGTLHLEARVDLLVCKDICVPAGADLALDVPVSATPGGGPGPVIAASLAKAPRPAPFHAVASLSGGRLTLAFEGAALKGVDPTGAYFFPYDGKTIVLPARQSVERGPSGLTLSLQPAPELGAKLTAPVTGVLEVGGKTYEISARPGPPPADAAGLGPVPAADEPVTAAKPAADTTGFAAALGLGLLGGLVLNLMPCVFPVLAMKAAALVRTAHDPRAAHGHGLVFMAGVVATFLALAGLLLAARAAGEAAGWGFQLQSPVNIAVLSLLMLAIGLNLSGVFEAGLSVQRLGGGVATGEGVAGAFFTGILTVLVAAPCIAPFMATALGYALTAPAPAALAVFSAMGVGLALPFTLLSVSPGLLSRLPRPGAWMETLRHVLAFPMYGTAAWLALVFSQQTAAEGLGRLFAAAIVLAFAAQWFGRAQHKQAQGSSALLSLGLAALAVAGSVWLALWAAAAPAPSASAGVPEASEAVKALAPEPYSPERLAELRGQGRQVFVNFTAAWCVTCKVNEAVALSRPEVAKAFADSKTAYLVGDWTRPDPKISQALGQFGRAGVPLYLVYRPGEDTPTVLPQLLTADVVVKAVRR